MRPSRPIRGMQRMVQKIVASTDVILRCAPLRASKDGYRPWPILRGTPRGANAPQGVHLRMTSFDAASAAS
jgi:hypothetical protein